MEKVFGPEPKAGMVYEGDFVGGVAKDEFGKKPGEDAKFFPFPAVGAGTPPVVSGGDAAVVLKDAKNGEAGMKLLEFLATPEAGEVWAGAAWLPLPEQERQARGLWRRHHARDRRVARRRSATRCASTCPTRPPRPSAAPRAAGEWKLLQDFLRDPSNPRATAVALEAAAAKTYGN